MKEVVRSISVYADHHVTLCRLRCLLPLPFLIYFLFLPQSLLEVNAVAVGESQYINQDICKLFVYRTNSRRLIDAHLLGFADWRGRKVRGLGSLRGWEGFAIGCAQALALVPGTSRSGITMTAALFLGFYAFTMPKCPPAGPFAAPLGRASS